MCFHMFSYVFLVIVEIKIKTLIKTAHKFLIYDTTS